MSLTRADKTEILSGIKKLVQKRHINVVDPNQDYEAWLKIVEERSAALTETLTDRQFEVEVTELLGLLRSSHTSFYKKSGNQVPARHAIGATLKAIDAGTLGQRWMFLDVFEGGAAFQAGIRPGAVLISVDGQPTFPSSVLFFKIGSNYLLKTSTLLGEGREISISIPDRLAKHRPPMIELSSLSHQVLDSDLGYLKVAGFPGAVGQNFAVELDRVIQELKERGVSRLIVDLRGNAGGGLGSLRLMSYLCSGKMEIGHSLTRNRLTQGYVKENLVRIGKIPGSKGALILMALRFKFFQRDRSIVLVTEGLGVQPFHDRVVILVNEHARSAAEMVASFAQVNRLATIVGKKTPGEVLGGASFSLAKGYSLRIPVAGWYTWQGKCIEGIGVEPDIAIDNSPESLSQGLDDQLSRAREVARKL